MNVAFRVDASSKIGIGHLIRCLALSEELLRKKHNCYFITKTDNEYLVNRIKKNNIHFRKMDPNSKLEEDRKYLIKFSNENDIDWIITDHYGLDSEYIKKLKKEKFKVLSIDDNAKIYYYSDIVLNQNIGSEKLNFSAEKYTKFLLGTRYVIIRDQLLCRDKKTDKNVVKKILIMLGGTDEDNLTLKILKMLASINENLEFLVLIGPLNLYEGEIKDYIKDKSERIYVIKSPKDMTKIYLDADIAISAGGSSCYELAYFGIPTIIVTTADNQLDVANELEKRGVSLYLGEKSELEEKQLKDKVIELLSDSYLREKMCKNGKKLVDGKGKERIVNFMERFS